MAVRQEAVKCVQLILCLASLYEGHMADHDNDHASDLSRIQEKVQTEDPNELFRVTNELGKVSNSQYSKYKYVILVYLPYFTMKDWLMIPSCLCFCPPAF
jgi:hypothetical protein